MPSVALSATEDDIAAMTFVQRPCKGTSTENGQLRYSIGVGASESDRSSMQLAPSPRTKSALYLATLPGSQKSSRQANSKPATPAAAPLFGEPSPRGNNRGGGGLSLGATTGGGQLDPLMRTWQCLESKRIKRLGLPPERHAEHYGVFRKYTYRAPDVVVGKAGADPLQLDIVGKGVRNEFAPFNTFGKPTCGFNFSTQVDHRKPKLGIHYVDTVKWRSSNKQA